MRATVRWGVMIACLALMFVSFLIFIGCKEETGRDGQDTVPEQISVTVQTGQDKYKLDLSEETELVLDISVVPTEAQVAFDLHGQEGISEENGKLIFQKTGNYEVTVSASYAEQDASKSVSVFVYDKIPLEGDGSFITPYLITSAEDLAIMAQAVNKGTDFAGDSFLQTNDINLNHFGNWEPIGTNGIPFEGIYDGQGHKIEEMTILSSESFQGLFGFVTGTVKNVNVYGRIVATTLGTADEMPYAHTYVGGIAGGINNGAVIENCTNYVDVMGDSFVGGIVGEVMENDYMVTTTLSLVVGCINYGNIRAVSETAKFENAMYYGGIAGRNNGIMRECINYGSVAAKSENVRYIGGIAGYGYLPYKDGAGPNASEDFASFESCENYGTVKGAYGVGGIVGQYCLTVKNCLNYAPVSGTNCVGGIAGIVGTTGTLSYGNTYLTGCENEGKIVATLRNGGGIAGYSYCPISQCVNRGEIGDGTGYQIGGIVGYTEGGKIEDCRNESSGNVCGLQDLGGIVGRSYQSSSSIISCTNDASVTVADGGAGLHVGGVVGMLGSTNRAENCYNNGSIFGRGSIETGNWGGVGGIAGSAYNNSTVKDCFNTGIILGDCLLGGIIGFKSAGTVDGCGNSGVVGSAQSTYVGGIVGNNSIGDIRGCTNQGIISGQFHIGGIVGRKLEGNIYNCVNEEEGKVTGEYRIGGIVGTSEAASSDNIWVISECTNSAAIFSTDTTSASVHIGGIVGMHGSYTRVEKCENYGAVTGRGNGSGSGLGGVGGISGSLYTASVLTDCVNHGEIRGSYCVGGIAGYGRAASGKMQSLTKCENYGEVICEIESGSAFAGGILGYGAYMSLTENNNYGACSAADGVQYVGYIFGKIDTNSSESNNKNHYVVQ